MRNPTRPMVIIVRSGMRRMSYDRSDEPVDDAEDDAEHDQQAGRFDPV